MLFSKIESIKNCILAYKEAFSFIRMHRLGHFFLFPAAFSLLLIISGWQGTSWMTNMVLEKIHSGLNIDNWDFWGASVLVFTVKSIIWIAFRLLFILIITYLGGYIIIILMSPVYAYLSGRTAAIITQKETPFDLQHFISDIFRGVLLALRNLLLEGAFTIILLILGCFPVIGFFSAPAMLLITAYFYGFAFIDYSLERNRYGIRRSIKVISKHKGEAIGIGLPFTLVLSVPFIGSFAAAFLSIPAVVAATIVSQRNMES